MARINVDRVTTTEDRSLPIFDEYDRVLERLRQRAYAHFAERGYRQGFDLEDWLRSEREICWPAAELVEEDDEFELKVTLPGFEQDEVRVTATPRELIVKAVHESDTHEDDEDEDEDERVCWSEFRRNEVYRRFDMPMTIDVAKVKAELKRGLLEIEAPKAAHSRRKPRTAGVASAA